MLGEMSVETVNLFFALLAVGGVVLATRSLFRALPQHRIDARVAAVEAGFDAAGIR